MNRMIWGIPFETLILIAMLFLAVIALLGASAFCLTMYSAVKRKRAEEMLIRSDTLDFARQTAKAMQEVQELTRRQVDLQTEILRQLQQQAEALKQGSQGI